MKITSIDKLRIGQLRQEMDTALKAIGAKYGVTFQTGRATYDSQSFEMKVSCTVDAEGTGKTKEALAFEQYAKVYGLDPSDLGKVIKVNRSPYTIVGLNTKAHKNVIHIKNADGKVFHCGVDVVKRGLEALAKA